MVTPMRFWIFIFLVSFSILPSCKSWSDRYKMVYQNKYDICIARVNPNCKENYTAPILKAEKKLAVDKELFKKKYKDKTTDIYTEVAEARMNMLAGGGGSLLSEGAQELGTILNFENQIKEAKVQEKACYSKEKNYNRMTEKEKEKLCKDEAESYADRI